MALKICFLVLLAFVTGWTRGENAFLSRMTGRAQIQGVCPTPNVMAGFDYSKFEGTWYLIQSELPNNIGVTCTGATFGHNDQSKTREAAYVAKNKDFQRFLVREPYLITQDPLSPAKLQIRPQALLVKGWNSANQHDATVVYSGSMVCEPCNFFTVTESYTVVLQGVEVTMGPDSPVPDILLPQWILDTDYTDYAILWGCQNMQAVGGPNVNAVEASVWARSRNGVKSENAAKVEDILRSYNISPSMVALRHTQTGCEGASSGTKPSSSNSGSNVSWGFGGVMLAVFAASVGF